jgi:hypothetical protein
VARHRGFPVRHCAATLCRGAALQHCAAMLPRGCALCCGTATWSQDLARPLRSNSSCLQSTSRARVCFCASLVVFDLRLVAETRRSSIVFPIYIGLPGRCIMHLKTQRMEASAPAAPWRRTMGPPCVVFNLDI